MSLGIELVCLLVSFEAFKNAFCIDVMSLLGFLPYSKCLSWSRLLVAFSHQGISGEENLMMPSEILNPVSLTWVRGGPPWVVARARQCCI